MMKFILEKVIEVYIFYTLVFCNAIGDIPVAFFVVAGIEITRFGFRVWIRVLVFCCYQ